MASKEEKKEGGWSRYHVLKVLLVVSALILGFYMIYASAKISDTPDWHKYHFSVYASNGNGSIGGATRVVADADARSGTMSFTGDYFEGDGSMEGISFVLPVSMNITGVEVYAMPENRLVVSKRRGELKKLSGLGSAVGLYVVLLPEGVHRVKAVALFEGEVVPNGEFVVDNYYRSPREGMTELTINATGYRCAPMCFDTDYPDIHFSYIPEKVISYIVEQDGDTETPISVEILSVAEDREFFKNVLFSLGFTCLALAAGVCADEFVKYVEHKIERAGKR